MASLVAFSPKYKKWYARPTTTATVIFVGPSTEPNPPTFVPATDIRLFTDPPAPTFVGGY